MRICKIHVIIRGFVVIYWNEVEIFSCPTAFYIFCYKVMLCKGEMLMYITFMFTEDEYDCNRTYFVYFLPRQWTVSWLHH
jgi:hypothetical protein